MAEFEGNLNLNVETSEIEIKGKFKLSEEELDKVAGGDTGDNGGTGEHVLSPEERFYKWPSNCPICNSPMTYPSNRITSCTKEPSFQLVQYYGVGPSNHVTWWEQKR